MSGFAKSWTTGGYGFCHILGSKKKRSGSASVAKLQWGCSMFRTRFRSEGTITEGTDSNNDSSDSSYCRPIAWVSEGTGLIRQLGGNC